MYTKQQILDISCRQIIRQGYRQSMSCDGKSCVYASDTGEMCAAAPFVTNKGMLCGVLAKDAEGVYKVNLSVGEEMRLLLGELQTAHDAYLESGVVDWEGYIRGVAYEYRLSADVLRSREAFNYRPFGTAREAIEFALEVDPSLDFEGLALDSVEEVREHVVDCWEDFEAPTYDGRVL